MTSNFSVQLQGSEPFEKALRRFSSKMRKNGILQNLRKRRFYTKPSVQKKRDRQKGILRLQKTSQPERQTAPSLPISAGCH